ncbi:hypothetical protein V8F33_005992 [Rhypophila sp. PSN 637]
MSSPPTPISDVLTGMTTTGHEVLANGPTMTTNASEFPKQANLHQQLPTAKFYQKPLILNGTMSQPPINHANPGNNWARRAPAPSAERKTFKPMDAITHGASTGSALPPIVKNMLGFSANYKGDATNIKNRSANIPPHLSTSLYLTNIPNGCSVKNLLDVLTLHGPFGKIYQVYISPGTPENGYSTSAAKIAMFTRQAAEALFVFIKGGRLLMGGYVVRVAWNRVLVPEQERRGSYCLSRVLVIEGPKKIVSFENLERFLRSRIVYQLQDVKILEETGPTEEEEAEVRDNDIDAEWKRKRMGTRKMEWVFGSYRAQAQTAKMALKRRWPELLVRHGVDPVAVGLGGAASQGQLILPGMPTTQRLPRSCGRNER